MQRFRNLGLIETNLDRFLVINENKLTTDYLARIAIAAGHHRGSRDDSFQTRPVTRQQSLLSQRNSIVDDPDIPTVTGQVRGHSTFWSTLSTLSTDRPFFSH
jgi:hypothetical protein